MSNINFENCIVSQDENKNFLFGRLVVTDMDELRRFRDGLIKGGFESGSFEDVVLEDYFKAGTYFNLKYNALCSKDLVSCEDGIVVYKESFIYHLFPVTVSILSSLLGDLNPDDYDDLTRTFIENGSLKCESIYKAWNDGLSRIFGDGFSSSEVSFDYLALRFVIKEGLIRYDVFDNMSSSKANQCRLFDGKTYREFEKTLENSEMLLGIGNAKRLSDVDLFLEDDTSVFTRKK